MKQEPPPLLLLETVGGPDDGKVHLHIPHWVEWILIALVVWGVYELGFHHGQKHHPTCPDCGEKMALAAPAETHKPKTP